MEQNGLSHQQFAEGALAVNLPYAAIDSPVMIAMMPIETSSSISENAARDFAFVIGSTSRQLLMCTLSSAFHRRASFASAGLRILSISVSEIQGGNVAHFWSLRAVGSNPPLHSR